MSMMQPRFGRRMAAFAAVLLALLAVMPIAHAFPAASGTKILYVYDNGNMSRTPQDTVNSSGVTIVATHNAATSRDWTLTPAIASGKSLVLSTGTLQINLVVACSTAGQTTTCANWDRNLVSVQLLDGSTVVGTSNVVGIFSTTPQLATLSMTLASPYTVAAGHTLVLRVLNDGASNYNRPDLRVYQFYGAASTVSFATSTVVNVDSVNVYSAPYPSTATQPFYPASSTAYVRAVISDPFGSADVSGADVTLTDSSGTVQLNGSAMTQVADSGAATRTYEYAYPLPGNVSFGSWTASVTGKEGTENTITHTATGTFGVGVPPLALTTSHSGAFTAGGSGSYSLLVHNNGAAVSGTTTVTDPLPAGLTYASAGSGGTGWTCNASGQTVTCTNAASIASGASLPTLTLNVAVASSAPNTVDNVAGIANPTVNGGVGYNGNVDATTIVHPDLSTSTQSVVDTNGGDALPGDTLQYTITLKESAGGSTSNVGVTDLLPAGVTGLSVISTPAGSVDTSSGSQLNISGISVPASGSATIVYTVTVASGDTPGQTIDNAATVTNPNGPGAAPAAPTVVVSQSQVAASGNKILYLYDNQQLTRTPQPAVNSSGFTMPGMNGGSTTSTWTLTPVLAKPLVLDAGTVTVRAMMACTVTATGQCAQYASNSRISVELLNGSTSLGSSVTQDFFDTTPALKTFTISLGAPVTIPVGSSLVLAIHNAATNYSGPALTVYQNYSTTPATIAFGTSTVIHVDSVNVYSAPYPATTTKSLYAPNSTVYVRATVSDPFGSYDVNHATVTLTDANGAVRLTDGTMIQQASGTATKTLEYAFLLPNNAALGTWTASATGHEGTENTVTHTANAAFDVGVPQLSIAVSHSGDFTAGTTDAYSIVVHNAGAALAGPTTVVDTLPAGLGYASASGSGWNCSASGQTVTCTNATTIGAGADLATLALNVAVDKSTANSIATTATVSNPTVDGGNPQASNIDTATVRHADLSSSTHTIVANNGGHANPGDTLQYTLTLTNTGDGAAMGASVVDDIPAGVSGFSVASTPAGSADASTASGGASGTGRLNVTGIDVPVNGSATIVYNVTVASGDTAGQQIDNQATVTNPGGPGATPAAPAVIVSYGVDLPPLSVTTSHDGVFTVGTTANYSLSVRANGPDVAGPTTVADTLPAGLNNPSGSGSGWNCSTTGQTVTCTNAANMISGTTLPTLTLSATVAGSAPASVDNIPSVANPNVNGGVAQQGNVDTAAVVKPDLSTSTVNVVDTNGGDANPGDTLQYTITLNETGGGPATAVGLSATMPATVTGLVVASAPAGSTDTSTGSQLNLAGVTVPANGSATIVYNVTVAGGDTPGQTIDNTVAVTNPNGPGTTLTAPTVTVSPSQIAASGNKILYVYDNLSLTRVPSPATPTTGVAVATGATSNWTLTPVVATGRPLVLTAGSIGVNLVMACTGTCASWNPNQVSVELLNGTTSIGSSGSQTFFNTAPGLKTFTVTLASDVTIAPGSALVLRVRNTTSGGNPQGITVFQYSGARSTVSFATSTVIHVDSVKAYSAPYPATTTAPFYNANDTVYIRAVISDPFGSYDVNSAKVALTDANGTVKLTGTPMTRVADSGAATRTYEYAYTLPNDVSFGFWTAGVTGYEGTEGTVTHTANGAFGVGVPQLSVTTSHTGDFTAGTNGSYSMIVHNNGSGVSGTTTLTDALPTGLSYVAAAGTGWTCGASGQNVTCTNSAAIAGNASLPTLTLTVAVGGAAPASLGNAAAVAHPMVNGGVAYAGNVDTATILHPDLSTSTKTVVDTNGGDANPGDTLRYTITLTNSSAGAGGNVSVTDDMPVGISGFAVTAIPAGSTDSSTAGGGANGNGRLNIAGIAVPANGSVTIVYTVVVASGDTPGQTIGSTATVANPNGPGATPAAPTVTVSQSQVAASGNELLYVYDNQSLTRTPQATVNSTGAPVAANATADWTLAPAIATGKTLVLSAGSIAVNLEIACPSCSPSNTDQVSVELLSGAASIGTSTPQTLSNATPGLATFAISLAAPVTVPAGGTLVLRVHNIGTHAVTVYQYYNLRSTLKFATSTVISVDSVDAYSAAYPATTTVALYVPNNTVYVRAVISDPFGSADVGSATITLTDATGSVRLNNANMTQVADSGVATRTFEYRYVLPNNAQAGFWNAGVTGRQGTENTVTHLKNGGFDVEAPDLLVMKAVTAISDPVEGATRPKALPGATMQYLVSVSNTGKAPADSNSLVVTDPVPQNTKFVVGSIVFADGTPSSGLTVGAANIAYSSDGGVNWTYTPVADGTGADAAVTTLRVSPQGVMAGQTGANPPNFSITFRVIIK
jgi:uncharacterized repeat protein (TIGR01451 family)